MDPEKRKKEEEVEVEDSEKAGKRAKAVVEGAKEKASEKAVGSCPKVKAWAEQYAAIRNSSKAKFEWSQMPEVPEDKRAEVRRYARENGLIPNVKKVTVKDRHGKDIKCPIFPPSSIVAEVQLPKEKWDDSDYEQFKYLDQQVSEKMKKEVPGFIPGARIYNGKKYTWHHHHEPGKMQLVENGIHSATQHSGGREIWASERD